MVQAFKKVLELSQSQAAWVQMAFLWRLLLYGVAGATFFVRKYSYKSVCIIGLALLCRGSFAILPGCYNGNNSWFFGLGLLSLNLGLAFLELLPIPKYFWDGCS